MTFLICVQEYFSRINITGKLNMKRWPTKYSHCSFTINPGILLAWELEVMLAIVYYTNENKKLKYCLIYMGVITSVCTFCINIPTFTIHLGIEIWIRIHKCNGIGMDKVPPLCRHRMDLFFVIMLHAKCENTNYIKKNI